MMHRVNQKKDADLNAGLDVLRIINEPTVAAIAYVMEETQQKKLGKIQKPKDK